MPNWSSKTPQSESTARSSPRTTGWDTFSDETKLRKRAIELNNGRAAQMGILALMVHEKLDGHPYIINDLLGAPYTWN